MGEADRLEVVRATGGTLGHIVYAGGIGVAFLLRYAVAPVTRLPAQQAQLLPLVIAVVAVTDYAVSLWLERMLLTGHGLKPSAQRFVRQMPMVPSLVCAAFGVSIAVYGAVLWLLGAGPRWWGLLVGLACVHWAHSFIRWSRREELPVDSAER